MQTAETLLTIGALVLLGLFSLSLYSNQTQESRQMYQSQQLSEALLIGQRYIEEAEQLYFDENYRDTTPGYFSQTLGPDTGESYSSFDDIDDFNNYQTTITAATISFKVKIKVEYVDINNNFAVTTSRTYFKMLSLDVSATSDATQKALLSKLFAYHYFFTE